MTVSWSPTSLPDEEEKGGGGRWVECFFPEQILKFHIWSWTFICASCSGGEKIFRSEICDYSNPPVEKPQYEHICGRPLGLRFNKKTGELFIADGYFGLMKVAPDGGLAEPVVQEFDGVQFKFLNSLDFDEDGIIYFTDSSSKYYRRFVQYSMIPCIIFAAQARSDGYGLRDWRGSGCQKVFLWKNFVLSNSVVFSWTSLVLYFLSIEFCRHFFVAFLEADNSGRFLKYDPSTRKTTVLIDGLQFPNGVRVSKDGTFVVFAETRGSRCVLLA